MKHLIQLTDFTIKDIQRIFQIADEIKCNQHDYALKGKTIVLFFPETSLRTRVTFEKGIYMLGGQSILFPTETLNKKEEIKDVMGYLSNWADCVIVRHSDPDLLLKMGHNSTIPIINAMTRVNHPCEILSDLYSISKLRKDFLDLNYTFIGENSNIGKDWAAASNILNFNLTQCCPKGYEMNHVPVIYDIKKAMSQSDVVLTDDVSGHGEDFKQYQVTEELLKSANSDVLFNPCPPFTRGAEVSGDAIDSPYFVGYEFKQALLYVQQAIILYCTLDM